MIDDIVAEMKERAGAYPLDPENITIATICSHSSLQIFEAARRAGFRTSGIIREKDEKVKKSYDYMPRAKPDEFFVVDTYPELIEHAEKLASDKLIFIPHGSAVEYLRVDGNYHGLEVLKIPTYGNRKIIPWEFSREKQRQWLETKAGLLMPKEIKSPDEIDCPVIIKRKGAAGGKGAVILTSKAEYDAFMQTQNPKDYEGCTMQQFISGTRYYLQFIATPFHLFNTSHLEFFGIDRRDESDADEFYKLGSRTELMRQGIYPSFNVTGNVPVVMRESLLMNAGILAGQKTVNAARKIVEEGLIGPFCLETIVTPDSKMYVFEISARIVAGSNVMVNGSPYARFTYTDPTMNYADRMMHELKYAAENKKLDQIIT